MVLVAHLQALGNKVVSRWFMMAVVLASGFASGAEPSPVDFDKQIRPLLSDRCFTCHGPDAEQRQADLRLDLEADAKSHAVVPGDPDASELVDRIFSSDPDALMPPPDSKLRLSDEERNLIRRWVAEGAKWQTHWAFVAPAQVTAPQLTDDSWSKNDIDRFALKRMQEMKLSPAAAADRATLLRRVTFDLTGLAPSLAELEAFLSDDSPHAYEHAVDRLLKSQRYGERMASEWLDVARYSDTFGYQVDRDRRVWPYRDWVIRAFNSNMHYDDFITRQLAGDLLPDPTDDQILATTFNRLHPQKVEGGSVPEEFRMEYVADRTQTFATALLGLTMECCRCHDHKYDPLSQREYYQLSAFFDNIDEAGLYSYFTSATPTPTLLLADGATKKKLAEVENRIAAAEQRLRTVAAAREDAFTGWLRDPNRKPEIPGLQQHLDFESNVGGGNQRVPGVAGKAVLLSGDDRVGLKVGNFRRFDPFSVALWMQTPDIKDRAVVFHRSRAWTDAASRGYELLILDGRLQASLIHFWPGNAISIRTRKPIPPGQWQHVVVTYDGSSRAAGLTVYLNGQPADCEVVFDHLYKNITGGGGDNIAIGERFRDRGFKNGMVDEFRVYNRRLTPLEAGQLHDGASLANAINTTDIDEPTRAKLRRYYLAVADADYQKQLAVIRALREECSKLADGIPEIMVMRESSRRRQTYVLKRGAYDARGDQVSPTTPAVLPDFPEQLPKNRLGLARWLMDSDHPLTARVAVNRYWQMLFGQGLVNSPEDFGRQGQTPTHAELLDWLARDFSRDWDVQRMLKQMVMSATYQQSSHATPQQLAVDPDNRYLSRVSAYRLPAEMLRDQALAAGGLLVERIGGPPAKPYEVEVSFKSTKRDQGEGLYRRSVYTYWKRTGPAPVMMALDASKRDVCRVKRERTSTPLQTFVLMNGPQFVEASRAIAQTLLQQHPNQIDVVLEKIFRTLTSRHPDSEEQKIIQRLYQQQLSYFQETPKRADEYLAVGDNAIDPKLDKATLAAAAAVANALLSHDDVVMKH